jgi:hypothetical protein
MSPTDQNIESITTAMATIAGDLGPQAAKAIVFVYRLEAIEYLLLGFMLLGLSIAAFIYAKRFKKDFRKFANQKDVLKVADPLDEAALKKAEEDASWSGMLHFVSQVAAAGFAIGSGVILVSPYLWMAAFGSPAAWIAKKALTTTGLL